MSNPWDSLRMARFGPLSALQNVSLNSMRVGTSSSKILNDKAARDCQLLFGGQYYILHTDS
jgi:hypothetical protein